MNGIATQSREGEELNKVNAGDKFSDGFFLFMPLCNIVNTKKGMSD
jgi:hypothetical protein